ncbi:MAG: hypothetical protein GY847_40480 [Proteobacteria bacterium]|nr:hypothetical protein [Pseudomonadota bacterium]
MLDTYKNYIDLIEKEAIKEGLGDFRLAREEFHNLTGKFEDGEPWFELRMTMFIDWYLLDRPGPHGVTPLERFLMHHADELNSEDRSQMEHLTVTLRSVFQIVETKPSSLKLKDLARGGEWLVHSALPTIGLTKGDVFDARIVFFDGQPTIGKSIVLHPREANETIQEIVLRANDEGLSPKILVDHLDKMRLKLDRYSNVRIQHVYRYPGDAIF